MNIISSSYGNDSIALIQHAKNLGLEDVYVVFCDTGWAAPTWLELVTEAEEWVVELGYKPIRVQSIGMEELVRIKQGFPANQYQFCTAHLKGIPFLSWCEEFDPDLEATVLVGKRRAESKARADTPEYIENSEFHGDRLLWHPLYKHSDEERNALLDQAGFDVLPHRSQECSPCVNANRQDFLLLTTEQIERVNNLEVEMGRSMFRPKRFGALGIHGVIAWAHHGKKRMELEPDELIEGSGCDGHYGCGL
jgi:3'-phosphoadenosine 5'-phosphosulfate sulfotransferase (PAPS reductase)/FAD synthetase